MDYGKVYTRFWKSKTVRAWDDQVRMMALYLLTSHHATSEGYYHLPMAYMAADLGWTEKKVVAALDQLDTDDFARYDHDAEVVFVVKGLSWNTPKGKPQVKGMVSRVIEVPPSTLLREFTECREGYSEQLCEALIPLREGIERVSEPPPDPVESSNSSSSSISSSRESADEQRMLSLVEPPASKRRRAHQLPDDWKPNEAHRKLAAERSVDLALAADKFRDHAAANERALKDWDAGFRNWLRNERPSQNRGRPAHAASDAIDRYDEEVWK